MPRFPTDDPEMTTSPIHPMGEGDLPLFAEPAKPWPQAPAATAETRGLELPGTIEGEYAAWRRTQLGERIWHAFVERAKHEVNNGARRLSSKHLCEQIRADMKMEIDNRMTALLARETVERFPQSKGLFEMRTRTAS
jgi:hypothetical protein